MFGWKAAIKAWKICDKRALRSSFNNSIIKRSKKQEQEELDDHDHHHGHGHDIQQLYSPKIQEEELGDDHLNRICEVFNYNANNVCKREWERERESDEEINEHY